MKKFFKQLLCRHENIETKTECSFDVFIIVKTQISCTACEKTFAQHPNAICCHVAHIQHEMIQEKFYSILKIPMQINGNYLQSIFEGKRNEQKV